ncbi:hypothetical protein NP493_2221g00005 [Ridgeia piscesae]|jgi:hypothetical protein|uniref:Uncharacterized protein n=1 Tax=Ridgeia piscesae TaxID=27915 RepID=A0AAD9JJG0_RIDPI|nr:hypothetical protein NP493_2221g00005 [Ridgeia piscesae]
MSPCWLKAIYTVYYTQPNGQGCIYGRCSDQKQSPVDWALVMKMSKHGLPKKVLYSQLSSGHRKRGLPRLLFKDTIKRNLQLRDI